MGAPNGQDGQDAQDAAPAADAWAVLLDALAAALADAGAEGWLVGGGLRAALVGSPVPVRDLDVAVAGDPLAVGRLVRERVHVTVAELNRDAVRLGLRGRDGVPALQLDLAPLHGTDIRADLRARDFTVNAMALPLPARGELLALLRDLSTPARTLPSLLDPLGGRADLNRRVLTPASEYALRDDPGRILRGARLVAAGFSAAPETLRLACDASSDLPALAPARLRTELGHLLALPRAADGLALLDVTAALSALLPELDTAEARRHAIAAVRASAGLAGGSGTEGQEAEALAPLSALAPLREWYAALLPDGQPRLVALRLGLLLHARGPHALAGEDGNQGAAAGMGYRVLGMRRLELPAPERAIVYEIDAHAAWTRRMLAEGMPEDAALRHLFDTSGEATVDTLVAAACCDAALRGAPVDDAEPSPEAAPRMRAILDIYFGERARLIPPALVSGSELIREAGMAPGPAVGRALRAVRRAQLDGVIGTREEALAYTRALAADDGATPG
jgi:poly(A) polymerase/tRNA nucleotidyltransferase (CCA-adding enzyme)